MAPPSGWGVNMGIYLHAISLGFSLDRNNRRNTLHTMDVGYTHLLLSYFSDQINKSDKITI